MHHDFNGKVFMVTGSSSGIGRGIAIALVTQGADVILHGRKPSDAIEEVADEIEQLGRQANKLYADFSDSDMLEPFVESAWRCKGHIDGWINNAGGDVLTGAWKEETFARKLDYLLKTDVTASLMLSRYAGKKMLAQSIGTPEQTSNDLRPAGVILNIGWDQAWQGMEGDAGELFATTKGAIMAMTKSLAQSLAPHVRVNCIAPGWIETKWGQQTSSYWDQRAKSESLMNRWGSPDDIAAAALYLCSPSASFVSGHILPINGGFRFSPLTKHRK